MPEDRVAAGDHVDARGDHGGRVDEGGDRGGTGHGVGEPDVQGELRRLADRPDEEQQGDGGEVGGVPDRVGLDEGEHAGEVNGAEDLEGEEDRQEEAEVADAVDDERLLPCRGAPVLLEVEADQQVAAQPDALPADEQDDQVGPEDEGEHGEHEEVEVGEVTRIRALALAVHVPHRVDVDQKPHERHEEQHHRRQRVQPQREVDRDVAGGDPAEHLLHVGGAVHTGVAAEDAEREQ